jgi:hypothetical protein
MKSLFKALVVLLAVLSLNVFATTKCVPDGRGGMCCWDVESQGPFKPISC